MKGLLALGAFVLFGFVFMVIFSMFGEGNGIVGVLLSVVIAGLLLKSLVGAAAGGIS